MTATRTVTPTIARRLAITKQYLAGPQPGNDPESMLGVIRDLGCLQLDPISVVARSHLLVLWSRLGAFDPAALDRLLWEERRLFEYWAHCASIVLTEEYPIHHLKMHAYASDNSAWAQRTREWLETNSALRESVLNQLRDQGPRRSQELEDIAEEAWHSSGWSGGRTVSRMLDFLWSRGEIMVARREGGHRYWDLAERCLPAWTPQEALSEQEVVRFAAQKALRALGVARPAHITQHYIRGRYPNLKGVLATLEREGEIVQVTIRDEGHKPWPGPWYLHSADLPLLERLEGGAWEPRTVLLSPFDNLIADRARTELFWDFRFRIEIYTPRAKREYGYYVLPILHGDRLVGRIDPVMDRKARRLTVNAIFFEPTVEVTPALAEAVQTTMGELGRFLGASELATPDGVERLA